VLADDRRRDVARLLHRGRAYGYAAAVRVAPGKHRICVIGVDVGRGRNELIGCRVVTR